MPLINPSAAGTPAGSDTYVQINDAGVVGADAGFAYNKATDALTIVNKIRSAASAIAIEPGDGFYSATIAATTLNILAGLHMAGNSPAQITADQNNYDVGPKFFIRLSSDASRTITGITDGTGGAPTGFQFKLFVNVGAQDIVFAHQNASSADANKIITSTAASITMAAAKFVLMIFDTVTNRWRAVLLP